MAYHLAEEARAGLSEFSIPSDFRDTLFDFQSAAVKIAARHLEKRGGVIIGDVVGLGKTLMAIPGPQHQRSARASRSLHPSRQPLTPLLLRLVSRARKRGRSARLARHGWSFGPRKSPTPTPEPRDAIPVNPLRRSVRLRCGRWIRSGHWQPTAG